MEGTKTDSLGIQVSAQFDLHHHEHSRDNLKISQVGREKQEQQNFNNNFPDFPFLQKNNLRG